MEIYYCGECRSRVSSVDIDAGRGLKMETGVTCQACAKKQGLSRPPAEPIRTAPTPPPARKRSGTSSRLKGISRSDGRNAQNPPPAGSSSTTIVILLLGGIVALLILVLVVLAFRKSPPPSSPRVPSTAENPEDPGPDPAGPGPAPDKSGLSEETVPVSLPEKKPKVLPAPGAASFPPAAPAAWKTDEGWENLLGAGWEKHFKGRRGTWESTDRMLMGLVPDGEGAAILGSVDDLSNYEIRLQIAVSDGATFECQFHKKGSSRARIAMRGLERGTWYTLRWQIERGKVIVAELNGRDIIKSRPATVSFNAPDLPMLGGIQLIFNPNRFKEMRIAIGELSLRRINLPPRQGNLIVNGDLEYGQAHAFDNWRIWDKPGTCILRDTEISQSGRSSLRMENFTATEGGNVRFNSDDIHIIPGRKYILTYWLKTEGFHSDSGCLGARVTAGQEILGQDNSYRETEGWTQRTVAFNSGKHSKVHIFAGTWTGVRGKGWFDNFMLYAEGAEPVKMGPWVSVLDGADLGASGWEHSRKDLYQDGFELAGGILAKNRDTVKGVMIGKTCPFNEGEFLIDFDLDADYWEFMLHSETGAGSLRIGINRTALGRHELRIIIHGSETELFLDGRPAGRPQGISIGTSLKGSMTRGSRMNILMVAKGTLSIKSMKYRGPVSE